MMGGGGTVLDIRKCLADYNETVDTYIAGNAPELYKRVYEYLSSNDKTVVDNYFKLKHCLKGYIENPDQSQNSDNSTVSKNILATIKDTLMGQKAKLQEGVNQYLKLITDDYIKKNEQDKPNEQVVRFIILKIIINGDINDQMSAITPTEKKNETNT
jgi:hypothetical protein